MTARIAPGEPPFHPEIQERLDRLMPPGVPPLVLFTTLARDKRLFERFMGAGLLDRGHLTMRQREIVIDRTTGLCRSEYEWGVHIALFAARVGFTPDQVRALAAVGEEGPGTGWSADEAALIEACDALHANCDIGDELWGRLRSHFSEEAIIEILMLAGFYHTVSYLTNALKLPLEAYAARFPVS